MTRRTIEIGDYVKLNSTYDDEFIQNLSRGDIIYRFINKTLLVSDVISESGIRFFHCTTLCGENTKYFTTESVEIDTMYYRQLKMDKILNRNKK